VADPKRWDVFPSRWLTDLNRRMRALWNLEAIPPLNRTRVTASRLVLAADLDELPPAKIWAQLLSRDGNAYAWREVYFDYPTSTWLKKPNGLTGKTNSFPAYEYNLSIDVPVGSTNGTVVQMELGKEGIDYYFFYKRGTPNKDQPPPGCGGAVCVSGTVCFGTLQQRPMDPGKMTVTVVSADGTYSTSGTTDSTGKFCFTPPKAGNYTVSATTSCDNFLSPSPQTLNYQCTAGGMSFNFPADSTKWPHDTYVNQPCCNCCPPCTGQPANKIPRTLYCTLSGPFGLFGSYAGVPLTMTIQPDSADPAQCATTGTLHYSTGCIGGNSAWGTKWYTGHCGNPQLYPDGVHCIDYTTIKQVDPTNHILYQSFKVDLWINTTGSGICPTVLTFGNYWDNACAQGNPFSLPFGVWQDGYPNYSSPCRCAIPGITEHTKPFENGGYPLGMTVPFQYYDLSVPGGITVWSPSLPYPCGPVNISLHGLPIVEPFAWALFPLLDSTGAWITWGIDITQ
jgi:hypothetical protein